MTDRFAVRTTDRGFGVWDAAVNGWHGKRDVPRDEAVQLAGKMNASVAARQTATGAGSRKVAPPRQVLVQVRDTWWPGQLDWWVRESDGWHGRVRLEANGATSWYPSDALRQVGDEPDEGASGRATGGSGSGPSAGTTGPPDPRAGTSDGRSHGPDNRPGNGPGNGVANGSGRRTPPGADRGRGAPGGPAAHIRRVGRRRSPVDLYRTGDHRSAGRAGGGRDGGNRLDTSGVSRRRFRLLPDPAKPIREHNEVCCPQRVIMSADPCYETSVRVLRSRARIDRRSRPRSTGMKDAGRNRPR
ncbi:hypothetical protein JOD67_004688 [Tenggerimyces flavus]|nr:hypothetical protein [Tenggerimyces flavus]